MFHWKVPQIVNDPMNKSSIPRTMSHFLYSFTLHGCRERSTGEGVSLGKEVVLAASGRADEVAAWVGQVRRATFRASCYRLITRKSPGRIVGPERLFFVLSVLSGIRNRFDTVPSESPMRTLYQREGPAVTN